MFAGYAFKKPHPARDYGYLLCRTRHGYSCITVAALSRDLPDFQLFNRKSSNPSIYGLC